MATKQAQFEQLRNSMTMEHRGELSRHLRTREGKKHDVNAQRASEADYDYWIKYLRSIGVKERPKGNPGKRAELDRYNIDFTYIKGGATSKRSATGYQDMRRVRSETWKSTRRHKGGRAYRVETVNVTKGRKVK